MGYIKEPDGVTFVVEKRTLSIEEEKLLKDFLKGSKARNKGFLKQFKARNKDFLKQFKNTSFTSKRK
ncbi:hypothetical protein [Sediminitomix flava]|uniref:Uncharacterized protein n=1 Tax=Sediminitomix flava TaxID=379075 RepID=A0A315ZE34_SEDFL|nr:hypothetical protein [Sediminitomix flava]PWJ43876.1 hypothetical protein BC781_101222 [Sediminitomix flava]